MLSGDELSITEIRENECVSETKEVIRRVTEGDQKIERSE